MTKTMRVKNFRIKKSWAANVCLKIITPIISKHGKMIIIISTHVKDHGRTGKGVVHSKTPYIQKNKGSSYWRGGAMQEGALKRSGSIFCCHHERRSCCRTFATKGIETVVALFATRRYQWLRHNWSEKILCKSSPKWPWSSLPHATEGQTQRDWEI